VLIVGVDVLTLSERFERVGIGVLPLRADVLRLGEVETTLRLVRKDFDRSLNDVLFEAHRTTVVGQPPRCGVLLGDVSLIDPLAAYNMQDACVPSRPFESECSGRRFRNRSGLFT